MRTHVYRSTMLLIVAICCRPSSTLWAQAEQSPDPLGDIALDMQGVAKTLAKMSTDKNTQQAEQQVIVKLDALIAQLEKERNGLQGGRGGARPRTPLRDSVITGGPGGIGQLHAPRLDGRRWGDLPLRDRERILQSLTEGFPPHYQEILERYYKQLAEEKPAGQANENPVRAGRSAPEATGSPSKNSADAKDPR